MIWTLDITGNLQFIYHYSCYWGFSWKYLNSYYRDLQYYKNKTSLQYSHYHHNPVIAVGVFILTILLPYRDYHCHIEDICTHLVHSSVHITLRGCVFLICSIFFFFLLCLQCTFKVSHVCLQCVHLKHWHVILNQHHSQLISHLQWVQTRKS